MKLSFELKLEIYEKHLAGYRLNYLADEYHLTSMINLIQKIAKLRRP